MAITQKMAEWYMERVYNERIIFTIFTESLIENKNIKSIS